MDNEMISHAESDEKILTFDVPQRAPKRKLSPRCIAQGLFTTTAGGRQ